MFRLGPKLKRYIIEEIAKAVEQYILEHVPEKKLRYIEVDVRISDEYPYTVTIDVDVGTTPFIKDEVLRRIVDEAINVGFRKADELFNRVKRGEIREEDIEELEEVGEGTGSNAQER